jgi:hypothetical protein
MRNFSTLLKPATGASLVLAAATACSSSSALPPATAVSGASVMRPSISTASPARQKKPKPLLFAAIPYLNEVIVYDQGKDKTPVYTITTGLQEPQGITTDTSGNLYVANLHSVTIYPPGATSPSTTITNGVSYASDVAVDYGGNIYVTNNGGDSGQQWINFYPAGATAPSYTWYPPQSGNVLTGIALIYPTESSQSEVYVTYFNTSQGYPVGSILFCEPAYTTCFATGDSLGQTGGIAVESSKTSTFKYLAVNDNIPGFDTFTDGQMTPFNTGFLADYLTFNSTASELYVSDESKSSVVEYSYPAMKILKKYQIPESPYNTPAGVAVSPSGAFL